MPVKRVFLHYKGEYVHLPDGETIVGRGLSCRLRFNDAAVSRKHLVITVAGGQVSVRDLGSTNGTKVNRQTISAEVFLEHRDRIGVGGRELSVVFLDEDEREGGPEITSAVEITPPPELDLGASGLPTARVVPRQTCSQCGSKVDPDDERCRICGYTWADFRTDVPTTVSSPEIVERRRHPRCAVDIPVLYCSDRYELQSLAKNLSLGGVFISSEFLDPVGAPCRVTVMVDGGPAVELAGMVKRVVEAGNPEGVPPGLGIEFSGLQPGERDWVSRALGRPPRG